MISDDGIPDNLNTAEFAELSKECWVFIGIAIAIFVIATAIILYMYFSNRKKVNTLQKLVKDDISDTERELLLKYRALNDSDKSTVQDTLTRLSNHHEQNDNSD